MTSFAPRAEGQIGAKECGGETSGYAGPAIGLPPPHLLNGSN